MERMYIFEISNALIKNKEVVLNKSEKVKNILMFFKEFNGSSYKEKDGHYVFTPGKLTQLKSNILVKTSLVEVVEILLIVGIFFPENINVELEGITNTVENQSVDMFKITHWKIFKLIMYKGFSLEIKKRGFAPEGQGIVVLKMLSYKNALDLCKKASDLQDNFNVSKIYNNFEYVKKDKIEKIRGLVISSRLSSECTFQMIKTIKGYFKNKFKNTKVMCICNNKNDSGPSPGYECSISAESKNGVFFVTKYGNSIEEVEEVAKECCLEIITKIKDEFVMDSSLINTILFYFAYGKSIGKILCKHVDKDFIEFIKSTNTNITVDVEEHKNYYIVSVIN